MTDRPILFKGPLVRAILEDRKTQTRRVMKPQEHCARFELSEGWPEEGQCWMPTSNSGKVGIFEKYFHRCPYGVPGDRLWVCETWRIGASGNTVFYKADDGCKAVSIFDTLQCSPKWSSGIWIPSIFTKRWASRITLDVIEVRVERLQDITPEDAIAEGITKVGDYWSGSAHPVKGTPKAMADPVAAFRDLWDSINAKPKPCYGRDDDGNKIITHYESFPWDDVQETREHRGKPWYVHGNPWLWVVTFRRAGECQ